MFGVSAISTILIGIALCFAPLSIAHDVSTVLHEEKGCSTLEHVPAISLRPEAEEPEQKYLELAHNLIAAHFARSSVRFLAKGGESLAFEVRHENGKMVVVTVPRRPWDPRSLELYALQRRMMRAIKNKNPDAPIINFYGTLNLRAGEEVVPALVTEEASGTLSEFLPKMGNKIDLLSMLKYMRQLAKAIDSVHKIDSVHRDLAPKNIFVYEDPKGNGLSLKVGDFGLSSDEHAEPPFSGTPSHMDDNQLEAGPAKKAICARSG